MLLQSASSTRKMVQRYPRGNHPAYTTVAKFQASTRDPQDEPPRFSYPHSSRSKNSETSEKSFRKEKKKQRRLDHKQARKDSTSDAGVHTSNVTSMARKDLSHITCFNCNKKGHYATKCSELRKNSNTED